MDAFYQFLSDMADLLWSWPTIILLLGTHILLTIRLRFPQRYIFKAIKMSVTPDKDSSGDVSQFRALATSLAATIGTGNIVGVGTAIALGGPGAVLWCWVTGILGIATKYSEGLLAVKYRVRTSDGTMLGGPMYALERGLNMKWLAVLFCIFAVIASYGIGCTVQANAISNMMADSGILFRGGIPTWINGLFLSFLVALVIIFGVKGIARVCGVLVPFMAAFYVLGCILILCFNSEYLGQAISLICESAFSPEAAGGGFIGTSIMMTARYGIARGLFSNESGLGSAPIVAAAAQTKNPVRQALVSSTATFWDTVVVCAITGLVLVSSIIAHPDITYEDGGRLTTLAFSKIPYIGRFVLEIGLFTFAFSTILGWSYYGERCAEYLFGKKILPYYKVVWVIMVFIGAVQSLTSIWCFADSANALMAIPNLIALIFLSGVIRRETRKYLWKKGHVDDQSDDEIPLIK